MYLRLSRTRIHRGREHEVIAALRTWVDTTPQRPQGMLDVVFARRVVEPDLVEHVSASLWTDRGSMIEGLGRGWDKPAGLIPDVDEQLDDHRIEHFEVFADDWPALVAFAARSAAGREREAGAPERGDA